MNHIISHIEYLVRRHDCVVLPAWGAFIAQYQSARFDSASSLFYPPLREISFNTNVHYNDGLLIASVARKEAISYADAAKLVERDIEAMKHQLATDGQISLGKIGRFVHQENSDMIFDPADRFTRFDASGLIPVALTIGDTIEAAEPSAEESDIKRGRNFIFNKVGKIAAAAIVALAIGVAIWIPIHVNNAQYNYASVTPVVTTGSADKQSENNIAAPQANADAQASETDAGTTALRMNEDDPFCLVVATLGRQAIVDKFIAKHPDFDLKVNQKNGRYFVYVATGRSLDEAVDQLAVGDIAKTFRGAWATQR